MTKTYMVDSKSSKSLNRCKNAGVEFNDFERNFSHFLMTLLLDFSEILNICRYYSLFLIPA